MNPYYIGEPGSPERVERLLCGLASARPDQAGVACERQADVHLLVIRGRWRRRETAHGA